MNDNRDNSEYHIVRPEQTRSAYSDAYYRSAPQEGRSDYGYNPARYYPDEEDDAYRGQIGLKAILALALVCAIVAGVLGAGGLYILFRDRQDVQADVLDNASSDFFAEARMAREIDGPLNAAPLAPEAPPMAGEDIYRMACGQVVGVFTSGGQNGRVSGSGIIISDDGYILTNYHVIQTGLIYGWPVTVVMHGGEEYAAQVTGTESDSDLAVLKIDARNLTAAVLGDSESLTVGQTVYAVGNPMGDLPYTMTRGIISARDRRITMEENVTANMFQFDAAVNSGNSGGPVYNVFGQVVGVATAKYTNTGVEGLGFAIPISDAVDIANELITKGYVSGKAYLGLTLDPVSPAAAQYFRMVPGAFIKSVQPDSAADKAGLRPGDIITAVDGAAVLNDDDLISAVRDYSAGDTAELTVYRDREYVTVSVTFDEAVPVGMSETP